MSEALAIESGDYDLLLNSKSEFGRNAIAVQNTRFGDRLWEQRDREPYPGDRSGQSDRSGQPDSSVKQGTKRTGDSSLTPETDQVNNDDTEFLTQYSQRRKRQRTERRQEATEDIVILKPRRSQCNSELANTSFRNLNTSVNARK